MKIEIDENKCIGAGQCVNAAPKVFTQREEDGVAVILPGVDPGDHSKQVQSAIRVCPVRAILVK